ncbi:hypothetical protein TNCV_1078761 [Trichonephila clavipes]|nr:hypothetical protein TNCV_1078761 [Trichonephila clavipes]
MADIDNGMERFTDEYRFCLQHHYGQSQVWRHRGGRLLNCCYMHRSTGLELAILIYGGIDFTVAYVYLVLIALDSRPAGPGLMPPNTLRVHTEHVLVKSVGPKVLWTVAAENHGCWVLENIPLLSSACLNCGGGDSWCRHLSYRSPTCLRLWPLSFAPFGKDTSTTTTTKLH